MPAPGLGPHPKPLGVYTQALESSRLDPTGLQLLQIGQWPPAPEVQRLLNEIRRQLRASPLRAPAPDRQPLEATTVHLRSRGASPLALAVHLDRPSTATSIPPTLDRAHNAVKRV